MHLNGHTSFWDREKKSQLTMPYLLSAINSAAVPLSSVVGKMNANIYEHGTALRCRLKVLFAKQRYSNESLLPSRQRDWGNARPDITVMVDWTLITSYLSINPSSRHIHRFGLLFSSFLFWGRFCF